MRATLSFTLPDERVEHQNAVDAGRAFSLLQGILEDIRAKDKYGKDDVTLASIAYLIREEFPDIDER